MRKRLVSDRRSESQPNTTALSFSTGHRGGGNGCWGTLATLTIPLVLHRHCWGLCRNPKPHTKHCRAWKKKKRKNPQSSKGAFAELWKNSSSDDLINSWIHYRGCCSSLDFVPQVDVTQLTTDRNKVIVKPDYSGSLRQTKQWEAHTFKQDMESKKQIVSSQLNKLVLSQGNP